MSTTPETACPCDQNNGIPWHDHPDCPMRSALCITPETDSAEQQGHFDSPKDAKAFARSLETRLASALSEIERLNGALEKINAIRNSIIGVQSFNFSEHAYPLVAALNEAGFAGMDYPKALEYFGSMLERTNQAEAQRDAALAELAKLTATIGAMGL